MSSWWNKKRIEWCERDLLRARVAVEHYNIFNIDNSYLSSCLLEAKTNVALYEDRLARLLKGDPHE